MSLSTLREIQGIARDLVEKYLQDFEYNTVSMAIQTAIKFLPDGKSVVYIGTSKKDAAKQYVEYILDRYIYLVLVQRT